MTNTNLLQWNRNAPLSSDVLTTESLSSLSSLQREMNKVFNNIWAGPSTAPQSQLLVGEEPRGFFTPRLELSETDSHLLVAAELPGVSADGLTLTLSADGTVLIIKGQKKLSKEKMENDFYFAERLYGSFRRVLDLPCEIVESEAQATFLNGVLEISLPKLEAASANSKRINVSVK